MHRVFTPWGRFSGAWEGRSGIFSGDRAYPAVGSCRSVESPRPTRARSPAESGARTGAPGPEPGVIRRDPGPITNRLARGAPRTACPAGRTQGANHDAVHESPQVQEERQAFDAPPRQDPPVGPGPHEPVPSHDEDVVEASDMEQGAPDAADVCQGAQDTPDVGQGPPVAPQPQLVVRPRRRLTRARHPWRDRPVPGRTPGRAAFSQGNRVVWPESACRAACWWADHQSSKDRSME